MELRQPSRDEGCLERDLSLVGSSISLVHCEGVRKTAGFSYIIQSVEVNPSSGAGGRHKAALTTKWNFISLCLISL